MTPWEKRASMHDAVRAERRSSRRRARLSTSVRAPEPRRARRADEAPASRGTRALPKSETALAATEAGASLSRVGAAAPDALSIPLPAMRMTMPSVPVYGPRIGPEPAPVEKPFFTGKVAAAIMFVVFLLLLGGAVFLLAWLSGPS